jgi:hypothetical protein
MTSYLDVAGVNLDNPEPVTDFAPGDRAMTMGSSFPVWVIVALNDDRAWVKREDCPWIAGLTSINRLRRAPVPATLGEAA